MTNQLTVQIKGILRCAQDDKSNLRFEIDYSRRVRRQYFTSTAASVMRMPSFTTSLHAKP
jgi:hypothetical protein